VLMVRYLLYCTVVRVAFSGMCSICIQDTLYINLVNLICIKVVLLNNVVQVSVQLV
jgi:hypothetical protein